MRRIAWLAAALLAACSGSRQEAEEPDEPREALGGGVDFGSETAEDQGRLSMETVRTGLQNQGCSSIEAGEPVLLEDPGGMALIVSAELCEPYQDDGRLTYLVGAIGNQYVLSHTLQPLMDVGRQRSDQVEVLSLEAPRVSQRGPNVLVLRYRTPPSSAEAGSWVERAVIGTFGGEALNLAIVQPLRYDVRVGGGRLVGDGTVSLEDTDHDGDLDVTFDLTARGTGCGRSGPCRNGEHRCHVTIPWQRNNYQMELTGDDCLYLGRLEL